MNNPWNHAKEKQPKTSADIEVVPTNQKKNLLGRIQIKLDDFQLRHEWLGFAYAVQKKYSQDQSGNLGALITYYGFLSLFPLLVAALSLAQLSLLKGSHLKATIVNSLNTYFPLVGHQLQSHVHVEQKAGIALGLSILLTIYGARGVASALQQALNHIWQIPKAERASGIKSILRSLSIIFAGGFGFIVTGFLSSYATHGNGLGLEIGAMALSLLLTFGVLMLIFDLGISPKTSDQDFITGSIIAAVGLQIIQAFGGFIITHELKHFSSLYGSLGIIFVILFWIYLQVRILVYATEVDSVRKLVLWPRSLTGFRLTEADRRALVMYAERETYIKPPSEKVRVKIKTKSNQP